jgi:hypothetical protein
VISPDAAHQFFVQLGHQADGQRQGIQALDAVIERGDVVANFPQVLRASFHRHARVSGEQFSQGGLGAFDPAEIHRLALNKGPDQQVRVGQTTSFPGQPSENLVGIRQRPHKPRRPAQRRGKRVRMERAAALRGSKPLSGEFVRVKVDLMQIS